MSLTKNITILRETLRAIAPVKEGIFVMPKSMLKSLARCYSELNNDKSRWSYYGEAETPDVKWETKGAALNFIESYFAWGGKSEVFKDKHIRDNRDKLKERAQHTVSTYLLGILIAECLEVKATVRNCSNINFLYLWFVACLYHDVGYVIEKSESGCDECALDCVRRKGISGLIKQFSLNSHYGWINFCPYTRDVIDLYLKHRANSDCCIDHGIVGGLLLHDALRENYERQQKNQADGVTDFCVTMPNGASRFFSESHFPYYVQAAEAVISHNIWQDTLKECYKEQRTPLNIQRPFVKPGTDNLLALILSLADTIEPVKTCGTSSLQHVFIGKGEHPHSFRIAIEKCKKAKCSGATWGKQEKILSNIRELEEWVTVSVKEFNCADNKVVFEVQISNPGVLKDPLGEGVGDCDKH